MRVLSTHYVLVLPCISGRFEYYFGEYTMITAVEFLNDTTEKATELSRKSAMAALGIYSKAVDQAKIQLETVTTKGNGTIDELLERGTQVEEKALIKIKEFKQTATTSVENGLETVREAMTSKKQQAETDKALKDMSKKLNALTKKVNKLAKAK